MQQLFKENVKWYVLYNLRLNQLCDTIIYFDFVLYFQARQEIAKKIRNEFPKDKALVVHFDSKQLVFNRKKTEKLAVVVTGLDSVDQIINSAFLESGTGQAVAEVVFESLQRWGLDGIISGKCYDTTNVNTGERNGAAVILERMLGRKLLDFPCRHHIYELVLMTAYKSCFNQATTSPDDILFKSFRNEWDRLDQLDYSGFPEGNCFSVN